MFQPGRFEAVTAGPIWDSYGYAPVPLVCAGEVMTRSGDSHDSERPVSQTAQFAMAGLKLAADRPLVAWGPLSDQGTGLRERRDSAIVSQNPIIVDQSTNYCDV
jgi:hypothetical protein